MLTRDSLHLRQTVLTVPAPALVTSLPRPSAALRVVLDLTPVIITDIINTTFKLAADTINKCNMNIEYRDWV